jgi:hypothetical protein
LFRFSDFQVELRLVQLFLMPLLLHLLLPFLLLFIHGWFGLFNLYWLQVTLVFRQPSGRHFFDDSVVAGWHAFHFFDARKLSLRIYSCGTVSVVISERIRLQVFLGVEALLSHVEVAS